MEDLEKKYPSVTLAYEWAIGSYNGLLIHWEAANSLLYRLAAMAVSIPLALPVLAKALGLAIPTQYVWWIGLAFLVVAALCLWGRLHGTMRHVDPARLFNKHLHKPPAEFKKDMIYWAGVDFEHNAGTIQRKWICSLIASFILGLELVALVSWLVCS